MITRPQVVEHELEQAYKAMAADQRREKEAGEWSENLAGDEAINFDPSIGGEVRKTRPAVIVSNDSCNRI